MEEADFKHRYRVDQVPWYWWLPMELYGWSIGFVWYLYICLVILSSKISCHGGPLDPAQNYIYCFWHENIFAYMCLQLRFHRLSLFIHPVWYMRPSHVVGILKGVNNTVLGSSGNDGKKAAARLTTLVANGENTFFTPDGPDGPVCQIKKGALYVALNSNTPIVGMTITASSCFRLKGWDRKVVPLPFGRIEVSYGSPFVPTLQDMNRCVQKLGDQMNGNYTSAHHLGD